MQRKSHTVAIILSVLLGGLGIDRFYLGYTGIGVLKLLTAGCFGILYIIDIVNIATQKLQPIDGMGYDEVYQREQQMQIMSSFQQINANVSNNRTNMDELIELKKLFDMGALTEDEFNKKKKEILGL